MIPCTELWLPILLSAVFVFVASSIIHMATPMHKRDYLKLGGEEKVLAEMRSQGVQSGSYRFPFAETMAEMGSPEMLEKLKRGPVGVMTVLPPGPCSIGKSLVLWVAYSLVVGWIVALVAAGGLHRGAGFASVFHVTGLAGVLGYAMGALPESIWKGQKWSVTGRFVFDGVVYGVVTGATFGWLWPAGA